MYDLKYSLSKCGKETFIKYFIEIIKYGDSKALEEIFTQDNFTINTMKNNATAIKDIIKNKQIKDALANIAVSKKVELLYIEQARRLLKDLYGGIECESSFI